MLILNNWYIAALSREVNSEKPVARMICDKPLVFYRNHEGQPVALEDRCMHRGMPLSHGTLVDGGKAIMCPYHGLEFDGSGACIKVPSQPSIPRAMCVESFPVVERHKFIWIWMGSKALADPDKIPVLQSIDDPMFDEYFQGIFEYQANWQLIYDNVMDLSHVAFVHNAFLNDNDTEALATSRLIVDADDVGNRVSFKRETPNCIPPPQYKFGADFKGRIDRWQDLECCPSGMLVWSGGVDAGTGAYEGRREGGVQIFSFHGITPASEGKTYYFAYGARNVHHGNEQVAAKMREGMIGTLKEDVDVIEIQQRRLNETRGQGVVSLAADSAGLKVRRMFRRIKESELEQFPLRPDKALADLGVQLGGL